MYRWLLWYATTTIPSFLLAYCNDSCLLAWESRASLLVQLCKWRQYAGCLRLFYSCVPQQHSVRTADVLLRHHPMSTCAETIRNYGVISLHCYYVDCSYYAGQSLDCTSSLSFTSGRVQLVYNSQWGNICDGWSRSPVCAEQIYKHSPRHGTLSRSMWGSLRLAPIM